MSNKQLFIPEKIAVGFQNREDTYTKKLAYIIYYDQKGTKRKEKSWNNWRDHGIADKDFENKPTEGFVLNKGVGGARHSYGWNARNEYIRVYDPRDFEFEISVANLLFILRECDCSRGKGLEGKFVYSWDGTELVLLPVTSNEYQVSSNYTKLQGQSVKAKDMIPGGTYTTKKEEELLYLGRFDRHTLENGNVGKRKKYVFWGKVSNYREEYGFIFKSDLKSIAVLASDVVSEEYAGLVEKYSKSIYGSKIVNVFADKMPSEDDKDRPYYCRTNWVSEVEDGVWDMYWTRYHYQNKDEIECIYRQCRARFENGKLSFDRSFHATAYNPDTKYGRGYYSQFDTKCGWIDPTDICLYAELESGSKFILRDGSF